jgi:hypothetical protein
MDEINRVTAGTPCTASLRKRSKDMPYQVSYVQGEINFEALPVAKITKYPLEKADYKPYAQCCLCVGPDGLSLRMWAFEVFPSPESEITGEFHVFENPELTLNVRAVGDNPVKVEARVGEVSVEVQSQPHNGEDLQGVYWGAQIFVPYTKEMIPIKPGVSFKGNFYKRRTDKPHGHSGSFADSMDSFEVVSW